MASLEQAVSQVMSAAFASVAGSDEAINPRVHSSQHADFQADGAMGLAKQLGQSPREIAALVVEHLLASRGASALIENASVAGPGFINLDINNAALNQRLGDIIDDERIAVPLISPQSPEKQTIVVDYSAPNVAKEMHVGHLRSTIIGDACVRLLQWLGHDVIRHNHIGDWGTPFGMLIEHLIDMGEAQATHELSVGDLNSFYRAARQKFDADNSFQVRARSRVVLLQSGDAETLRLWKLLIEQSQSYFVSVYERMDVLLDGSEFMGESAYNDMLKPTLEELEEKNLIVESDGADCLYPKGFTNRENEPLPLIVRKRDGGFGYAATDLAAIRHRIQALAANRILYVVGAPQKQHLEMIYEASRMSGWLLPPDTAEHISFGSVMGADGKMLKSRSGETVKLGDLLTEAVDRAAAVIDEKNPDLDEEERRKVAEAVGIGAVKYADLSVERTRDYIFDFDQMLALEGNTAPYLQYAQARIQSILRQAGDSARSREIRVEHASEREIAFLLLQFPDMIEQLTESLMFNRLANYLYDLATAFSRFYSHCPVLKADDPMLRDSRLALCEITARCLSIGLGLLGIRAPQKM
ncbi:MAG: arginine--tRNA ligase [Granulosicoccus sp.]